MKLFTLQIIQSNSRINSETLNAKTTCDLWPENAGYQKTSSQLPYALYSRAVSSWEFLLEIFGNVQESDCIHKPFDIWIWFFEKIIEACHWFGILGCNSHFLWLFFSFSLKKKKKKKFLVLFNNRSKYVLLILESYCMIWATNPTMCHVYSSILCI